MTIYFAIVSPRPAILAGAVCLTLLSPPVVAQESLSFRQVLSYVFAHHPSLKGAERRHAGSQAWARGAGAQPSPEIRLSVPAGDPSEEANSLVQRLEIGGQTGLRSKIADFQAQQAEARMFQLQRELGVRSADAYYSLWSTRETERLLRLRFELATSLQTAAQRRLKVGEISEHQMLRSELERAQAEAELVQARGQRKQALHKLNLLLQRPADSEVVLPLGAEVPGAEPTREALLQSIESRPEVRIAQLAAQILHLEADLLGRQRIPDVEFEAYRSSLGRGAEQGLRLSLVLPLWDWGKTGAAVAQKEHEAEAAEADALAQRQAVEQELLAVWELYLAERDRSQILRGQMERYLRQADLSRRGYEAGLLNLAEVFEAQRAYREATLEYVSAEASFQKRRWEVHWLTGNPMLETREKTP